MVPPLKEPKPPQVPIWGEGNVPVNKKFTRKEVAAHDKEDDCWVIIDGRVFDMSSFCRDHPGGKWPLLINAGKDATKEFHEIHNRDANDQKEMLCIGTVVDEPKEGPVETMLHPR